MAQGPDQGGGGSATLVTVVSGRNVSLGWGGGNKRGRGRVPDQAGRA